MPPRLRPVPAAPAARTRRARRICRHARFRAAGAGGAVRRRTRSSACSRSPTAPRAAAEQLAESPVKAAARARALPLAQPQTLKSPTAARRSASGRPMCSSSSPTACCCRREVLNLPRLGCLNIHGSLLPRWRGAAPIQRAILAGDAQSGVTIMQMDAGLDTGPDAARRAGRHLARAHGRLAARRTLGARRAAADRGAHRPRTRHATAVEQPRSGRDLRAKIGKEEAVIDWYAGRAGDRAPGSRLQSLADRADAAGRGACCGCLRRSRVSPPIRDANVPVKER